MEEEEYSDGGEEAEEVVVGQKPTVMVPRHINKRSLRNKSLSVSFNDKDLRDFVTGFHKRKKKRRKEAERHLKKKERMKRLEIRKRDGHKGVPLHVSYLQIIASGDLKKLELEMALSSQTSQLETDGDADGIDDDELKTNASVSETMIYGNCETTIRVTTTEISKEDEDLPTSHFTLHSKSKAVKEHNLPVNKKQMKRVKKHKYFNKTVSQKKGKRRKGGKH